MHMKNFLQAPRKTAKRCRAGPSPRVRASRNGTVTLDWPNRDVAVSMARLYSQMLLGGKPCVETGKDSLTDVLASGTLEDITARLNALMSALDYQAYPVRTEAECFFCLQTLMIGAEMVPGVKAHEEAGRSALEVDAGNRRWVFEI